MSKFRYAKLRNSSSCVGERRLLPREKATSLHKRESDAFVVMRVKSSRKEKPIVESEEVEGSVKYQRKDQATPLSVP
jgi:Holliday junction resolvase